MRRRRSVGGEPRYPHAADALGAGFQDVETVVARHEMVAALQDGAAGGALRPLANGLVRAPLDRPAGLGLEFAQREAAADDDVVLGALVNRAAANVEFVTDVAHDLLEHVLEGYESRHLALDVEHDDEMAARVAELLHHDVQRRGELELQHRPDQRLEGRVGAEDADLPEPLADEQQALDLVERARANRKAAVTADLRRAQVFGD